MHYRVKKGMTVVEMLVAIFILTLIMTGFTVLANKTWKANGYVIEQATATAAATRTLNQVIHEIRSIRQGEGGVYPIKQVSDNSLTVYREEDTDGRAERVHYFIEDGKLKKGVTHFTGGAYAANDETVKVLLNWVTNEDLSQPLFFYYNNDYPVDTTNNPMATPNPYDVRLIRVHIWINVRPIVAPEYVNLESFVELRNLNEN